MLGAGRMTPDAKHDRPRERLRRLGAAALSDAELLALVLGTGAGGDDALTVARRLLARTGGLVCFTAAGMAELEAVPGIGGARAAQLRALGEIGIRVATRPLRAGERLLTGDQVYRAYGPRLRHERREVFLCIALDAKRRVLAEHCVAQGHLTGVEVHPRELYRGLVRESASAAVVVHNHPSGDPTPSPDDVILTRRLWQAGLVVGIELLDHIVVGDGRFVSMRADGALGLDGGARLPQDRGSGSVHEGWP